jgi:hypothetical protein
MMSNTFVLLKEMNETFLLILYLFLPYLSQGNLN